MHLQISVTPVRIVYLMVNMISSTNHGKILLVLLSGTFLMLSLKKPHQINLPTDQHQTCYKGAIIRGDSTQKKMSIVFTGDEFADGADHILTTLKEHKIKASFFFTGRFYSNPAFTKIIQQIKKQGHYLGAHSDQHLLYCDWTNRDSLLVTKNEFTNDLKANYKKMKDFGINKKDAVFFIPPYEWYNDTIAAWTKEMNLQLINFTPGTISHADYTTPLEKNYRSSDEIFNSITKYEEKNKNGMNGFILLLHIGTDPRRTDKFYNRLDDLIIYLKKKNYELVSVTELLCTES